MFVCFARTSRKEYPVNSAAMTNLQHRIQLTQQPTPINSVVFAGASARDSFETTARRNQKQAFTTLTLCLVKSELLLQICIRVLFSDQISVDCSSFFASGDGKHLACALADKSAHVLGTPPSSKEVVFTGRNSLHSSVAFSQTELVFFITQDLFQENTIDPVFDPIRKLSFSRLNLDEYGKVDNGYGSCGLFRSGCKVCLPSKGGETSLKAKSN